MTEPTLDFIHTDGLRHRKWVFPAYFCGVKNCCEGKPVDRDSSHGIGAERWLYVVGDAPFAVSMEVSSGRYLPETYQGHFPPTGVDMSWHKTVETGPSCLCLSGASCWSDGTGLGAAEWYEEQVAKHGTVTDDRVFEFLRTDLYVGWKRASEAKS